MAVRLADIDVTGIDRTVRADVLARVDGMRANFGHAGPAFVQTMIAEGLHLNPEALRDGINGVAQKIVAAGMNGAISDAALTRSANVFAVLAVAGGLAQQFGLLPESVNVHGAVSWAWDRFRGSSDAVALDPAQQAIANIQVWIAERWGASLQPIGHEDGSDARPMRDAVGWFDDVAVYLPDRRLVEAAGGTLKEVEIAKALKAAECLVRTKSDKHTYIDHVPKVGRVKAYALSRGHFGRGSEKASFRVMNGGRF